MQTRGKEMGRRKPKRRTMAREAELYELYESAVQNVEEECRFMATTFEEIRDRSPAGFREDFCGTASAACEWVRQSKTHYAFGVDLDADVLTWGRKNRVSQLGKGQRQRLSLIRGDVREVETLPVDVVGAFNFSYWIFKTRAELRGYFETVYRNLGPEGVFFLDAYGGYAAFEELKEELEFDDFTYIWEQAKYNPVNGHMKTHIHFRFSDGSKLKKAFTYKWRLWTLPELQELLEEAGFCNSTIHFEATDDEGDGLGHWFPVEKLAASRAWIVNITAEK
jgi:SAM-dependent methyltransferase